MIVPGSGAGILKARSPTYFFSAGFRYFIDDWQTGGQAVKMSIIVITEVIMIFRADLKYGEIGVKQQAIGYLV